MVTNRSRFSCALASALVIASVSATAGSTEDVLSLNMSKSIKDRMFWDLNVVSTKTKTKSEQPRDMTPEIVKVSDLTAMRNQLATDLYNRLRSAGQLSTVTSDQFFATLNSSTSLSGGNATMTTIRNALQTEQDLIDLVKIRYYGTPTSGGLSAVKLLDAALSAPIDPDPSVDGYGFESGAGYLTTPQGIRATSGNPSDTLALSVGYYLNDDHNWAVEAVVLGLPLNATIYGAGTNDRGTPNQLVGKEIIETKLLPPIAKLGYYFGDNSWAVRPYVGIGAMYAVFFDTKTTPYFDQYQGGKTSVSLKSAFGIGPFVGLQSNISDTGWHVGLSVGKIRLKTEATLVTRNTMFRSGDAVLSDYKQTTSDAIENAEALLNTANNNATNTNNARTTPFASATYNVAPGGMTTELMKDLGSYKKATQGGDGTLGTFVRKQRSTLDNTILMLSIGKSF